MLVGICKSHEYACFQEMSKLVTDYMASEGTQFLWHCRPQTIEKASDGRLLVSFVTDHGETKQDVFNTVLMATGTPL